METWWILNFIWCVKRFPFGSIIQLAFLVIYVFWHMKLVIGCKNTLVAVCKFHFIINCMMIAGAERCFFFLILGRLFGVKYLDSSLKTLCSCGALSTFVWYSLCCFISFLFFFSLKQNILKHKTLLLRVHKEKTSHFVIFYFVQLAGTWNSTSRESTIDSLHTFCITAV